MRLEMCVGLDPGLRRERVNRVHASSDGFAIGKTKRPAVSSRALRILDQ
jgi:hypothetical protein